MGLQYTAQKRMMVKRAVDTYCASIRSGARTRFTMRGGRRPDSKRASDPARNTSESTALGHELLQYFVDELQALRARSDATILKNRVRELRA